MSDLFVLVTDQGKLSLHGCQALQKGLNELNDIAVSQKM